VIGLYAIALGPASADGLRALPCGEMTLLVGDAPPPLSAEALRAHDARLRQIAERNDPCLPARFGAAAADDESLLREMTQRMPELLDALELVRGREQMTLRVHGRATPLLPPKGGPGTRWLEERRRTLRLPELDPLRVALLGIERAERVERHDAPDLIASVYHLIDRGAAAEYRAAVDRTPIEGLQISVTGPWPAWSFAPDMVPR
jgi:hypothetical protein